MLRSSIKKPQLSDLTWINQAELVGLVFELIPPANAALFPDYSKGLHAWFLDQVRQSDPDLSRYLHDGQSEKPFTLSRLEGIRETAGRYLQLTANESYYWYLTGLSQPVIQWLGQWLSNLPSTLELRNIPLKIQSVDLFLPPTTYEELFNLDYSNNLTLSFISPTSFRRKGHHFPLPVPANLFHSYLRRWNDFSDQPFDSDAFLDWVDDSVIITRHWLESLKVAGGKKGSVTGFIGAISLSLSANAKQHPDFVQLYSTLGQLAPYCGTGHKTTFGLGQTRLDWISSISERKLLNIETISLEEQLAKRIEQYTEKLMESQKRTGGTRALNISQTRATILARREFGDSLQAIAVDLEMPYETIKTYAKLARRQLKTSEDLSKDS